MSKNKLEFFLFKIALGLFNALGLNITRRFASIIGVIIYYLIPIRKRTTIENLQKAFPDKSVREIKKIALENYRSITITFFELMCVPSISHEEMKRQVEFVNFDLLMKKLNEGKGLIIFTGHFGNWEFIMTSLAVTINYPINIMVKPQRNSLITEWLKSTRQHFGAKVIESGVSVKGILKALINKEIVGIAGDQRGHFDNPRFDFLNQPTALYTGAAAIALRTKSNVLLTANVRQKGGKYKCYMEELDFNDLPDNDEAKLKVLTQRYISFIGKYVRQNPEQYFWMHKIWKY